MTDRTSTSLAAEVDTTRKAYEAAEAIYDEAQAVADDHYRRRLHDYRPRARLIGGCTINWENRVREAHVVAERLYDIWYATRDAYRAALKEETR